MQENIANDSKSRDEALKKILQAELGTEAKIIDLYSVEKDDHYGDPILRIWVLYEAEKNKLDPYKITRAIDPMRDYIKKISNGLDRFPIMSFRIPEEVGLGTR